MQNTKYFQLRWDLLIQLQFKRKRTRHSAIYNGPLNCPKKEFRLHSFKFRMLSSSAVSVQISYIEHFGVKRIYTTSFDSIELTEFWRILGLVGNR